MKHTYANHGAVLRPQYVRSISDDHVLRAVKSAKRSVWIGALSFEERCTGSLLKLRGIDAHLTDGIIVDYETSIVPHPDGETRRARNKSQLMELADGLIQNPIRVERLSPYAFDDVRHLLQKACTPQQYDLMILDISCVTKIHTMAFGAFLALETDRGAIVTYAIPENYGFLDEKLEARPAWSDVILAPFSEGASLFYEANGRGIIIPGHEAHRLIVAIGEIEPAGGRILISEHPGRPDLKHLMLRRNQRLLQQLSRMRSRRWERRSVVVLDPSTVERELRDLVEEVQQRQAPILLFPFGPKSVVFTCAVWLSARYPDASWFVYPIPASYDVNYSFGIQQVIWFSARGRLTTDWI
jgi:hypothetical protein